MSAASYRGRGSSQRARIRELGARNPQPNFNQSRRDINLPPAEFWLENLPSLPWPPPPQPQQFNNFESHRYFRGRPPFCPGPGLSARGRSKRIRGEGRPRPALLPGSNFGGIAGECEPSRFPPLGSEEERQQKIAETADKLKLKLSSLNNIEEPVNFWEDDLGSANFSQESEELTVINRGIPELRHDPPELNLTVNDFKDIGRVDPDNSFNSGDSVEILSPEVKKSQTQVAEENPVGPNTKIKNSKNVADDAKDSLRSSKSPCSNENTKETTLGRDSEQVKAAIERLNYALACDRETSTPNPIEKETDKEVNTKHKPELTKSLEKLREVIKVDRELEKEEKSRSQPNAGPRLQPDVRMDFHPGIGTQYPRFQAFNHATAPYEMRNRIPPQFRNDHPAEIHNNFGNDFQLQRTRNFNLHPRGLDPRMIHPEFNAPVPQRMMTRNSDVQLPFDPRAPPPRFNAPFHEDYHRNQTWYNRNEFCPLSEINGMQQPGFNPRGPPQRFFNHNQDLGNFLPAQEFPGMVQMGYPHVPHIVQHRSRYFNPAMPPPNTAPCIFHKFPPPSVPHTPSTVENNQPLHPPPIPKPPLDIGRPPSPPKISKAVTNQNPTPNMNDELEDMQEALEFAKKLMNMTEETADTPRSSNMSICPDLPPIPSTEQSHLANKIETPQSVNLKDREKGKDVGPQVQIVTQVDPSSRAKITAHVDEEKKSKDLTSDENQDTKQKCSSESEDNTKPRVSGSKTSKTLLASTLESIWKEKVINRFLKMSKNDICNMVNSSGKRKNDIVMKQLVKEQKHSLSQERRCSADDAVKGACDVSQEEEFISQLKAVLDRSATVDIKNLPAEFIQQLSEVLKLDVETQLNDSTNLELPSNEYNIPFEAHSFDEVLDTKNPEIDIKTEIEIQPSQDFDNFFGDIPDAAHSPAINDEFSHSFSETIPIIPQAERSDENKTKNISHDFIRAKCTSTIMLENHDNDGSIFCAETTKPRTIDGGNIWPQNKRQDHDLFRNLTKEEWEAKELRNRGGNASSRSPKYWKSLEANRNVSPSSPARESNYGIESIVNTPNDAAKSDSQSDCSSISSDSDESTTSNVTKLLKVIKEKEKIAKDLTLAETMRDEVTAEIEKAKEKDRQMEIDRRKRNSKRNRRNKERKRKQKARKDRQNMSEMLERAGHATFIKEELIIKADIEPVTGNNAIAEITNSSSTIEKIEGASRTLLQESIELAPSSHNEIISKSFHTDVEKPKNIEPVVAESHWGKFESIESRKTRSNVPTKKIDIEAYKARKLQQDVKRDDKVAENEPSLSESSKPELKSSQNKKLDEKKLTEESLPSLNKKLEDKQLSAESSPCLNEKLADKQLRAESSPCLNEKLEDKQLRAESSPCLNEKLEDKQLRAESSPCLNEKLEGKKLKEESSPGQNKKFEEQKLREENSLSRKEILEDKQLKEKRSPSRNKQLEEKKSRQESLPTQKEILQEKKLRAESSCSQNKKLEDKKLREDSLPSQTKKLEEKKLRANSSPIRNEKLQEKNSHNAGKNRMKEKKVAIQKSNKTEDQKQSKRKETANDFRDRKRSSSREDSRRRNKEKSRHSSREKKRDNRIRNDFDDKLVTKVEQANNNIVGSKEKKSIEKINRVESKSKKNLTENNERTGQEHHTRHSPEHSLQNKNQLQSTKDNKGDSENLAETKVSTRISEPIITEADSREKNNEVVAPSSSHNQNNSESLKSEETEKSASLPEEKQLVPETSNPVSEICFTKVESDCAESSRVEETLIGCETFETTIESTTHKPEEIAKSSSDFEDVEAVLNDLIDKAISQLELLNSKNKVKEDIAIAEKAIACKEDEEQLIDRDLMELDFPETPEGPLKGFTEETIKSSILGKRKLDQSVLEITEDYIMNKKSKNFNDIMLDMIVESSDTQKNSENQTQDNNSADMTPETITVKLETNESIINKVSNREIKDEYVSKCVTPSGDTLSLGSTIDFDHNEFIVLSEISSDEDFSQDEDRKPVRLISEAKNITALKKIHNKHKVRANSEERAQKSTSIRTQTNKKVSKNSPKTSEPVSKNNPIKKTETIFCEDAGDKEFGKSIVSEAADIEVANKSLVINNDVDKKKSSESKKISKEDESRSEKNLHRVNHKHKMKHKKDKRWKLDEKQVKEIIKNEDLVTVVERRQTKEDVMARMVEIDLEIHKLMSEKMKLYQMLESGELPSEPNITQEVNDSEQTVPEDLKPDSRSLSSNENCRSTAKQKIAASKPVSDPSLIKSAKIIASCITEEGNQKDEKSKKGKTSQTEQRKPPSLDGSISRKKNDDKSTSRKMDRSESRCSSSSNSRRKEEKTREKKDKVEQHHGGAKKQQNKSLESKNEILLHNIKKETQSCSGNDDVESYTEISNYTTEKQKIYSDEGSQVSLSHESRTNRKTSKDLTSLEQTYKSDKTLSKKRRGVTSNKTKKEKVISCQKGANALSPLEEEMPLNLLLVKKFRKRKESIKNQDDNDYLIRNQTTVEVAVDHVSETINAVAQNKMDEHPRRRRIKVEIGACDNDVINSHRKSKVSCRTKPDPDLAPGLSHTSSSTAVTWPFDNVGGSKDFSGDEFGDLLCDDFDNGDVSGFPIDKIMEISRKNNGSDNTRAKLRAGESGEPLSLFSNFYTKDMGEKMTCRQWTSNNALRSNPSKSNTVNYELPRFNDSNSNFITQDQTSESHSISRNFKDIEKGLDILDSMLETVDLEGNSKKEVRKGKRKRLSSDFNYSKRNSKTISEMMNCSVRLVDCKYTYLKDNISSTLDQQCKIFNVISLRTQSGESGNNEETGITEDLFSPHRNDDCGDDWMLENQDLIHEVPENLLSINNAEYLNTESEPSFIHLEGHSVYDDNGPETMKLQGESNVEANDEIPNQSENIIQSYSMSGAADNWDSVNEIQAPSSTTNEPCHTEESTEVRLRAKPFSELMDHEVIKESEIAIVDNVREKISEMEKNCAAENLDDKHETPDIGEVELPRIQYSVHKGPILDVKVFGDSILAASEDGVIYRYSQTCNGILNTYEGHKSAVTCLYVFQDSTTQANITKDLMFSGSLDGSLRCFDIMTSHLVRGAAEIGSPVQCMDQSWGVIFLGTKSGYVFRFNIKSHTFKGDEIKFSDESVLALKATTEGPRRVLIVASRSQPITIRDAQSGLFLRTVSGHKTHTVYSLLMDSNLVYCGTSSTAIPVFDFINGSQAKLYNAGPGIVCMRMYKWLLFAGCYDGNIYVFDTKEGRLVCSIPGPGNMLLSMDVVQNKIVAGSKDRRLHMWQMPEQVLTILAEKLNPT